MKLRRLIQWLNEKLRADACQSGQALSIYDDDIISDLLWSDPCPTTDEFAQCPRGAGHGLKLLMRGHECIEPGFDFNLL
jgi:hypothetical protein